MTHDLKVSPIVQSWPYYLRTKTGCAGAYTFMIFPKDIYLDMSVYIQVIEDLTLFTDLTNDVLSYVILHLFSNSSIYSVSSGSTKNILQGEPITMFLIGRRLLKNHSQMLYKIPSTTH